MKDPLRIAAAGEAATGVSLILFPGLVIELLFDATETGAGLAAARIAGMALLTIGIACWPGVGVDHRRARGALLVYNTLATVYLGDLAISGDLRGPLLWPAVILHVVFTAVLAATPHRALSHGTTRHQRPTDAP